MVAGLAPVLAGVTDPLGARRVTADVLLLSRRLLQSDVGRSAGLRCGRTAQNLSRRALVSPDHAKRASLFSLSRAALYRRAFHRCVESVLVRRSRDGKKFLRDRCRHAGALAKRDPARRFHVWLPCLTASGGR